MSRLRIALFLFFVIVSTQVRSQPDSLSVLPDIPELQTAEYSFYVYDATTGHVVAQSPQKSLTPASVMKLVTTSTAMRLLGPDFQFKTRFGYNGTINHRTGTLKGDVIIKGGADPAFYSEYFKNHYASVFERWAYHLKMLGIKKIDGDVIGDASSLDDTAIPGGWIWEDMGNYYGAGVYGLTFSDNMYRIHFQSPDKAGEPARVIDVQPRTPGFSLDNRVVSSDKNSDQSYVYGAPFAEHQMISGAIPKGRTDFVVKGAMPNPPLEAADSLRKVINRLGIEITGQAKAIFTDEAGDFHQMAVQKSPKLQAIIDTTNHESVNLFAEHLLREIGRKISGKPTLEAGLKAVKSYWEDRGIYLQGFYQTDGSGLSRSNAICARTLVEVLLTMDHTPEEGRIFLHSLPIAGKEGTLRYFFQGTPLDGKMRAKSGSMERVRSFAGEFTNRNGHQLFFAVIVNNFSGSSYEMGKQLEPWLLTFY
jgi:serine-type D-Ala-D-Ala carboxypeptidase/endopeptidase (penicillin-binding protein 4)